VNRAGRRESAAPRLLPWSKVRTAVIGSEVIEIKRRLNGTEARFPCTLMGRTAEWAALRYVLPGPAMVGGLALPAGAETIAHYWTRRPYTAYHWLDRDGRTLGIYLNAAADVEIGDGVVRWLDLALDVLITARDHVQVLDDDEARAAPAWAQPVIAEARAHLIARAPAIAAEVTALTDVVRASGAAPRSGGGPVAERRTSP